MISRFAKYVIKSSLVKGRKGEGKGRICVTERGGGGGEQCNEGGERAKWEGKDMEWMCWMEEVGREYVAVKGSRAVLDEKEREGRERVELGERRGGCFRWRGGEEDVLVGGGERDGTMFGGGKGCEGVMLDVVLHTRMFVFLR